MKAQLRQLACSGTVRFKLDQLLDSVEFAEQQVVKTTCKIRRFCQTDPELSRCLALLRTIPGIGWIVASQLLARIGDWRELHHVRCGGGTEAHDAHRRGLDAAASVCGQSTSAGGACGPRGDIAPGNDSTTGRTGRLALLRFDA